MSCILHSTLTVQEIELHPLIIGVNRSIYSTWKNISDSLVKLIQYLSDRAIEFLERKMDPFPEYDTYFPMSEEEQDQLQNLVEKCDGKKEGVRINLDLTLDIEPQVFEEQDELYERYNELIIS